MARGFDLGRTRPLPEFGPGRGHEGGAEQQGLLTPLQLGR